MSDSVRVRFAPSPTGKLHIGGARTAIYNWAFARANGGTFILRIDDTDPTRSTDENTQIILRAMRWLGLDWDEGPEVGGDFGPYSQTERLDLYKQTAERLLAEGKAYPCFCTPEQLAADREAAQARKDPFQGYQRRCRDLTPEEARARIDAGEPYVLRIKVPDNRGNVVINDAVHGEVTFDAKELDDFVIFRSDGTPTYNFATVVDDALMGITHVIRGDDHLSNTPRQVMVYEAMGAPVPTFAHISMILGADGKKLSKRHGATSVEEYRDAGYLSDAFVNYLALLGWSLDGETTVIPRDVLASKFSLDRISKNPATFDPKKLDWMNAEYINAMDDKTFADEIMLPQLIEAGLIDEGFEADRGLGGRPRRHRSPAHQDARRRRCRCSTRLQDRRDARVRREVRGQGPRQGGPGRRARRRQDRTRSRDGLDAGEHRRRPRAAARGARREEASRLRRRARGRVRQHGEPAAGRDHGAHRPRRLPRPHRPRPPDGALVDLTGPAPIPLRSALRCSEIAQGNGGRPNAYPAQRYPAQAIGRPRMPRC